MNRNCIKSRRDKCPLADDCYGLVDDDDDCKCRLEDYNKGREDAIDECLQILHNVFAYGDYCVGCDDGNECNECDGCFYTYAKARINELKEQSNE